MTETPKIPQNPYEQLSDDELKTKIEKQEKELLEEKDDERRKEVLRRGLEELNNERVRRIVQKVSLRNRESIPDEQLPATIEECDKEIRRIHEEITELSVIESSDPERIANQMNQLVRKRSRILEKRRELEADK